MGGGLRLILAIGAVAAAWLALALTPSPALAKLPPLRDPVFLNIGFVCRWQTHCMQLQEKAMKRALSYVKKKDPPLWKVQQCNRNASRNRGRGRVDWIGYYNCIKNPALQRRAVPSGRTTRRR